MVLWGRWGVIWGDRGFPDVGETKNMNGHAHAHTQKMHTSLWSLVLVTDVLSTWGTGEALMTDGITRVHWSSKSRELFR